MGKWGLFVGGGIKKRTNKRKEMDYYAMKEHILRQFDETNLLYVSFGDKCKRILTELIEDKRIPIHHISSRIKSRTSLSSKIDSRKEDKYSNLSDITDICGLRIITYLESDVNHVSELIENEFEIDRTNSIDKRKLKSDQFGYRSLHYVVSLNAQRNNLSENKKFQDFKIEIQIRSILQHAWAEIEHDLGYKGAIAIPENLKRSFNRLAALLETADIEFDRLKKDINDYELNISKVIRSTPEQVKLDQASVSSFIHTNEIFAQAREIITMNTGCKFLTIRELIGQLERFELLKIHTIAELDELVKKNKKQYLIFVDLLSSTIGRYDELDKSLPLFYFQHYLASSKESEEFMQEYFDYGTQKMGNTSPGDKFIDIYKQSKGQSTNS